jgi:site-specific recombinase XerD
MTDLTQGMREVINAFLIDRQSQNLAKSTIIFYREKVKYLIDFCKAHSIKTVTEISPNDLRLFFVSLLDKHTPGGLLNIYAAVRSFLRWVESEERMPEGWRNPILRTRPPKVPFSPLEPAKLEDIARLIEVSKRRDAAIFYVLLDCGCRSKELLQMSISDLNLLSGEILIRKSKNGKPRTVYIGSRTRKAVRLYLRERTDSNDALWIKQGGERLQYFGLREILLRMAKKAHISPPPTLHSFRRAYALSMLRQNVSLPIIASCLGHSNLSTLQRYLKLSGEDIRNTRQNSPADNGL